MKYKRSMFTKIFTFALILLFVTVFQALASDENGISTSDIIDLVETLESEGRIVTESAVQALKMHLTAVNHYEQQGETEKVVKHMNSFKVLLDHHVVQDLMTEKAYDSLIESTSALIRKWEGLTIVQDGEPRAVIVVPPGEPEIPGWIRAGSGPENQYTIDDTMSYSGKYSLRIHDDSRNLSFSVRTADFIKVNGGENHTLRAMVYSVSGNLPTFVVRFYNERQGLLESFVLSGGTRGEWEEISMTMEAPDEAALAFVQLWSDSSEVRTVYYDDIVFKETGSNDNLLINPGFEDTKYGEPIDTLVEYVEKSTGAILPVRTVESLDNGDFADDVKIYIGKDVAPADPHIEEILSGLNYNGFVIHPHENHITIAGTEEWGTTYGVYEFLEHYLGIRWLMPGPSGDYIPQLKDVKIPNEDVIRDPTFAHRQFYNLPEEWMDRNKLQLNHNKAISFHHHIFTLFPVSKYGESHPEFYPNGIPPQPGDLTSWQPCFSAEGSIDAAVSGIISYFENRPDQNSFSFGINDSTNFCEANPAHPNYPGKTNSIGYPDMSGIYYNWINEVVEQVLEVYPDKWFGLLAYVNVMDPPSFVLHPRVVPFLTKDRMTWIDENIQADGHNQVAAWNEVANQIGWYDYMYGSVYVLPRVYPQLIAENFQYAKQTNAHGFYAEIGSNAGDGPKAWVSARLMWDPDQDVDELLQEWYEKAVGPEAAPYLKAYYELWEQFWTERIKGSDWFHSGKRGTFLPFKLASYLKLVTEEDLAESRSLMELVTAHAGPSLQQERANILMRAYEYYEASVLSYPVEGEVVPPANEQEALTMLDRIKQSLEMEQKRHEWMEEFEDEPALRFPTRPYVDWNGVQLGLFRALQQYIDSESEEGIVGEQVNQFLADLPPDLRNAFTRDIPEHFSANAVRTTASKNDILQSLDFNQGPWTATEPVDDFLIMNTDWEFPPVETKTYLLWDDENLYVGYENFDPDIREIIIRGYTGNSNQTFLAKTLGDAIYGHFTNPAAEQFTFIQEPGSGPETADDQSWETNAQIGNESWNVVQAIPFSMIGIDPNQTDTLMGLFFRNYNRQSVFIGWGGGAPWQPGDLQPIHLVEQ